MQSIRIIRVQFCAYADFYVSYLEPVGPLLILKQHQQLLRFHLPSNFHVAVNQP